MYREDPACATACRATSNRPCHAAMRTRLAPNARLASSMPAACAPAASPRPIASSARRREAHRGVTAARDQRTRSPTMVRTRNAIQAVVTAGIGASGSPGEVARQQQHGPGARQPRRRGPVVACTMSHVHGRRDRPHTSPPAMARQAIAAAARRPSRRRGWAPQRPTPPRARPPVRARSASRRVRAPAGGRARRQTRGPIRPECPRAPGPRARRSAPRPRPQRGARAGATGRSESRRHPG